MKKNILKMMVLAAVCATLATSCGPPRKLAAPPAPPAHPAP